MQKITRRAHFRENQRSPFFAFKFSLLIQSTLQSAQNSGARDPVSGDKIRPRGYSVESARVLHFNSVADVGKLSVFKQQKAELFSQRYQLGYHVLKKMTKTL